MIIKNICIRNFRSYYGDNNFEFKDGLTLLIGGNGDGKTTFFDALDWLFKTSVENKDAKNISEKCASELGNGEFDTVSVSMLFEHDGEKELEKSFRFEKLSNGSIVTQDFSFKGYECNESERILVSGKKMLDCCFDSYIRKYCLFKGESELNVFDSPTALKTLVEKFSDIRSFNDFVTLSKSCEEKAEKAYKHELKNDSKVSKKAKELDFRLLEVNRNIDFLRKDIMKQEEVANTYQIKVETLEQHQETSERYHAIKERLATLNAKKTKLMAQSMENYNERLLDDFWVLSAFSPIFKEFQKKASSLNKEERKQNEAYIEQRGREKGKREAIEDLKGLVNGSTHLPWYLPDEDTMQEMIDDQICKVCGRTAIKGTEAYEFMVNKLSQYQNTEKEQRKDSVEEEETLFHHDFVGELRNLSVRLGGSTAKEVANIKIDVEDRINFITDRKEDLKKIENSIQEIEEEKNRLLIQSDGISEELLDKNFKDIKGFFEQKSRAESKVIHLKNDLENWILKKKELDEEFDNLNPQKGLINVYAKIHTALSKIHQAFLKSKELNLRRFLDDLEEKSNSYLGRLNIDDFHGEIRILETANDSACIRLYSSNGTAIHEPNGALRTTMYMSVLLAISDLTTLKREADYPLIFDAPTSSFESFKEDEFYNIIDKIKKQCIIATKDFLDKDIIAGGRKLNEKKIQELTCSVYRIEKKRPFTPNDLSTICTTSQRIK